MKQKLISFNLLIITLVILLITGTGNYFYQSVISKAQRDYSAELQRQLSLSFFFKMDAVEKSLDLLASRPEILSYLSEETSALTRPDKELAVRELFRHYEHIYPEYLSMVLVSARNSDYLSNDAYRIVNDPFSRESWYRQALQEGYAYQFYNPLRNLKTWKLYDHSSFLSIAKVVEAGGNKLGVLLVDLSLKEMKTLYTKADQDRHQFFFLMDAQGQIILSPENELIHRIKASWFDQNEGVLNVKLLDHNYTLLYTKYADRQLIMVSAYDRQKEQAAFLSFFRFSLSVALVAFLIAITWSIYFVSKVTKPLSQLTKLMQAASTGQLELRFEEDCDTELHSLGQAFNKMVVKIKRLLELVYQEQSQKREAELQVLQEQIKPHFLYNTLDTIAWMARKHQASEIVLVVERLSSFFRLSLSKGKEHIPLSEELQIIRSYLDIQGLRYQELFTYEIHCPDELKAFLVPRLCLQPLVENCIYHGIKESDNEQSLLKIEVRALEGGLEILIQDNGKAMPPDKLTQLNQCLSRNDWSKWDGGFGIRNVAQRLSQQFAQGSRLRYAISEEGFTVARLCLYYNKTGEPHPWID